MSAARRDPAHLFTLRVRVNPYDWRTKKSTPALVTIHAFESNEYSPTGHTRIDVEVKEGGKVVFPRGATWCGVPSGVCIDGIEAKELVMSLVAMKPGDTDSDYFASYTPEQLTFAETFGEELDMIRSDRYCDAEGNVRHARHVDSAR